MKIGLLIPLQGGSGIWGPSCESCARLAALELSAGTGLMGEPVDLVVIDSGATAAQLAVALDAAVNEASIGALVGMHTSDLRPFVKARIPSDMPYVYTPLYEGNETAQNVFAIGETPERLLEPGIAWLAEHRHAKRWFMVGNDYVWPRQMHGVAARLIARHGGLTLGEAYVPLGTSDFDSVLRSVKRARPDAVLVSVIGSDAVHFNRAFAEAGLASRMLRFSTAVEENVLYGIGSDNTENMYLTAGYFADLRSAANDVFRERYHSAFGETPPMQNDMGQSCYEGLHYLAALSNHAKSLSARTIRTRMRAMPSPRSVRAPARSDIGPSVHLASVEGFDPRIIASV